MDSTTDPEPAEGHREGISSSWTRGKLERSRWEKGPEYIFRQPHLISILLYSLSLRPSHTSRPTFCSICFEVFVAFPAQYQIHRIRCAGSIGCVLIPSTRSSPSSILLAKSQRKKSTSTLQTPFPARPSAHSAAATRSTATIDAARMATSSRVAAPAASSVRDSSRRTSAGE